MVGEGQSKNKIGLLYGTGSELERERSWELGNVDGLGSVWLGSMNDCKFLDRVLATFF